MKLELEITEDEIRSAMEAQIRTAIANYSNRWGVEDDIRKQVKLHWHAAVDAMILDALNNNQALRDNITAELERKIRAQLTAVMKAGG